jgi:Tfp pilus assembly protein PilO
MHSSIPRQTSASIAVDRALYKRLSDWPKVLAVFLTIVGMAVGMAVWASNSHAEIKGWTAEQDYVTKTELKETMKEQYVPLHEFTKVKQSLEDLKEDSRQIEKKLDKVLDKLSEIKRYRK